jgi:hypothetical protein
VNPFVSFMQTPAGRILRLVGGAAMIAAAIALGGATGVVLAVCGVVPFAAGLFDVCAMAPFFKVPFSGARIRELSRRERDAGPR